MTDPSTGPIPRHLFAGLVDAPFGAAKKAIRRYDPEWGLPEGQKIQWTIRVAREGANHGRAWVDAHSKEEAEQLAANLSESEIDWDYSDDAFTIVSVEPDKR